jgi:hypothetical protein
MMTICLGLVNLFPRDPKTDVLKKILIKRTNANSRIYKLIKKRINSNH